MKLGNKTVYRASEFAALAHVTVRALHHYDRLGLLRPKQRSQAGYRLYAECDFVRLEQIVVLKFLGMPLKQIRRVLQAESSDLTGALQQQLWILEDKRRQMDRAIRAISKARQSVRELSEPDWKLFQLVIQEIQMQNKVAWKGKYFSPEAKAKVEERKKLWSPELQERASREWAQLFSDIEGALGEDPAGAEAQALAARWKKLVREFSGGDPAIEKGLNAMWADQANWPAESRAAQSIKPEVQNFILKAMRAAK
jgi:MerR family transcriptional regulator, thiopeptide resistance regulator